MKFQPTALLHVFLDRPDGPVSVGRLALAQRQISFEYEQDFLATPLHLSPFKLPLQPGLQSNRDGLFDGLFGLFNDSLPDGWGRLLMDRQLRQHGIAPETLTALDRLSYVGSGGMGALLYKPDHADIPDSSLPLDLDHLARDSYTVLNGGASDVIAELLSLNGSSAGARPKVMAYVSLDRKHVMACMPNTDLNLTDHHSAHVNSEMEAWMIKFKASQDASDAGAVEYAYSLMARAAGLNMPDTHLFSAATGAGFFGVKRFDRRGRERVHVHTISGLLHADHRLPALDYETILQTTMVLTKSLADVTAMFRLAVFNVLTHNRDDHAKNFSFLMEKDGSWWVAPAYDLTFSAGPAGEHCTMVLGEGKRPGVEHLKRLGMKFGIEDTDAIIDQVRQSVSQWPQYAKQVGVGQDSAKSIANVILSNRS